MCRHCSKDWVSKGHILNWSITFAPLIPVPVLIALAAVAIALVIVLMMRRSRGALIRLAALAANEGRA